MSEQPIISDKSRSLLDQYLVARDYQTKIASQSWNVFEPNEKLSIATAEAREARRRLFEHVAQLEQSAKPLKELSDDQTTDFYRLLYAWEDARDEYNNCLGGSDFDQVETKAKADAAAKAKADLVEFVKGLG